MDKNKLIVYGEESCTRCKVLKMLLESRNISYMYINVFEDEIAQHHLKNKAGDFSTPKIEYGGNIYNYIPSMLDKLLLDFK